MHDATIAESIGMIELTTSGKGRLWLKADSVYSIEKDPNEEGTILKTMMGDMMSPYLVKETPEEIAGVLIRFRQATPSLSVEDLKEEVRQNLARQTLHSIAIAEVYDELRLEYTKEPAGPLTVYEPPQPMKPSTDEEALAAYDKVMGVNPDD